MKIRIFALIIPILLHLCCTNQGEKSIYNQDTQEIILANIKATIGKGNKAKMAYRFPAADTISNAGYKKYYDSIQSALDTTACYIIFEDSVTNTRKEDIPDIIAAANDHLETDLIKAICDRNYSESRRINTSFIAQNIGLAIAIEKYKPSQSLIRIGSFQFSDISFSKDRNKAAVYMNYYCGGKCGFGEVRVLQKKNNIWTIIGMIRTWIS